MSLSGVRQALGQFALIPPKSTLGPMLWLFLVVLLRVVLRRPLPAYLVAFILLVLTMAPPDPDGWKGFSTLLGLLSAAIYLALLARFGLLATVSAILFTHWQLVGIPTFDVSTWYTGRFLLLSACYVLLLAWAYATATRTAGDLRAA